MLVPQEQFLGVPIMSLQTGLELAKTDTLIIDPRQLTIVAFTVKGPRVDQKGLVLHPEDIREYGPMGFIVDDSVALMETTDLVRLQEVMDFQFSLLGLRVIDEKGRKLGKVSDFMVEPESFTIQQLYTKQSLIRNLNSLGVLINRSQIVSIDNEKIIVVAPTTEEKIVQAVPEAARAFVNPFREATPN